MSGAPKPVVRAEGQNSGPPKPETVTVTLDIGGRNVTWKITATGETLAGLKQRQGAAYQRAIQSVHSWIHTRIMNHMKDAPHAVALAIQEKGQFRPGDSLGDRHVVKALVATKVKIGRAGVEAGLGVEYRDRARDLRKTQAAGAASSSTALPSASEGLSFLADQVRHLADRLFIPKDEGATSQSSGVYKAEGDPSIPAASAPRTPQQVSQQSPSLPHAPQRISGDPELSPILAQLPPTDQTQVLGRMGGWRGMMKDGSPFEERARALLGHAKLRESDMAEQHWNPLFLDNNGGVPYSDTERLLALARFTECFKGRDAVQALYQNSQEAGNIACFQFVQNALNSMWTPARYPSHELIVLKWACELLAPSNQSCGQRLMSYLCTKLSNQGAQQADIDAARTAWKVVTGEMTTWSNGTAISVSEVQYQLRILRASFDRAGIITGDVNDLDFISALTGELQKFQGGASGSGGASAVPRSPGRGAVASGSASTAPASPSIPQIVVGFSVSSQRPPETMVSQPVRTLRDVSRDRASNPRLSAGLGCLCDRLAVGWLDHGPSTRDVKSLFEAVFNGCPPTADAPAALRQIAKLVKPDFNTEGPNALQEAYEIVRKAANDTWSASYTPERYYQELLDAFRRAEPNKQDQLIQMAPRNSSAPNREALLWAWSILRSGSSSFPFQQEALRIIAAVVSPEQQDETAKMGAVTTWARARVI